MVKVLTQKSRPSKEAAMPCSGRFAQGKAKSLKGQSTFGRHASKFQHAQRSGPEEKEKAQVSSPTQLKFRMMVLHLRERQPPGRSSLATSRAGEAHLRSGVLELLKLEELVVMCDCKVAAAALTSEIFEYQRLLMNKF